MKYFKIFEVLANEQPSSQMYTLGHDIKIIYKPAYIIVTSSLNSSHFVVTVTMRFFSSVIKKQYAHTV